MKTTVSSPRHLRRFALIVATGLTVVAAISWWRGHTIVPAVFWSIAGVLGLTGLVAPRILGPVERGWLAVGAVLAWVNTRIILTVLFYIVVSPVAMVMRLFRDPLERRIDRASASYWVRRPATATDPKSYEQQF
jgi:Saxitoxin biosynthesis operon protein SxtJ